MFTLSGFVAACPTLLNEAEARFGPSSLLRVNDIENFHFLTSGQLLTDQISEKIKDNLEEIRDLIVNQKFTPFPPRPKAMQIINKDEYCPARDSYENSKHLHNI